MTEGGETKVVTSQLQPAMTENPRLDNATLPRPIPGSEPHSGVNWVAADLTCLIGLQSLHHLQLA